jgi:peptide chain release factor
MAAEIVEAAIHKKKKMENYILHITSGRGPAECCLAVALTLKEVLKEAEVSKLQTRLVERSVGIENRTLLSATVLISGKNAKQFCDRWNGSLLWICQSPFRKFHKRKNWFIGIQSLDKSKLVHWNERDISFQTMRSSGPGGQNVNKVESAVRAKYKSSGLMVMVNESRSQLQNKKIAVERLKLQFEGWLLKQAVEEQQHLWQQHNLLERGKPSRVYEGLKFKKN